MKARWRWRACSSSTGAIRRRGAWPRTSWPARPWRSRRCGGASRFCGANKKPPSPSFRSSAAREATDLLAVLLRVLVLRARLLGVLRLVSRALLLATPVVAARLLGVLRLVAGALLLVRLVALADLLAVLHIRRHVRRHVHARRLVRVDARAGTCRTLHANLRSCELAERHGEGAGNEHRE